MTHRREPLQGSEQRSDVIHPVLEDQYGCCAENRWKGRGWEHVDWLGGHCRSPSKGGRQLRPGPMGVKKQQD